MPEDESALQPLRQWPNDVSQELWRSRRQLFGDPDLGMSDADQGAAQYVTGIEAMGSGSDPLPSDAPALPSREGAAGVAGPATIDTVGCLSMRVQPTGLWPGSR